VVLRSCIEFVLQDDRGGLAIDTRPVGPSLCRRRRTARAPTRHRAEALLGQVARESLIPETDGNAQEWRDRIDPPPGQDRLAPLAARDVERQPDDDLRIVGKVVSIIHQAARAIPPG